MPPDCNKPCLVMVLLRSSGVWAIASARVFSGCTAYRQGALAPARYEPGFTFTSKWAKFVQ